MGCSEDEEDAMKHMVGALKASLRIVGTFAFFFIDRRRFELIELSAFLSSRLQYQVKLLPLHIGFVEINRHTGV